LLVYVSGITVKTEPSRVSAREWHLPAATETNCPILAVDIITGVKLVAVVVFMPSQPVSAPSAVCEPQAYKVPLISAAKECVLPAAILTNNFPIVAPSGDVGFSTNVPAPPAPFPFCPYLHVKIFSITTYVLSPQLKICPFVLNTNV
jgi:hypothetical protein